MMSTILMQISINLTNVTQLARNSITPYTDFFGNFFYGIFFGFIGIAIYAAGAGDSRIYLILSAYLIAIGIIFAAVLELAIAAIFGLVLAFLVSSILYVVFVESRT